MTQNQLKHGMRNHSTLTQPQLRHRRRSHSTLYYFSTSFKVQNDPTPFTAYNEELFHPLTGYCI